MAVIINNIDDKYFELNGTRYAKIYQPLKQGVSAIGIYNVNDTRQQLVSSTVFSEFQIDGVVYASQALVIEVLLPVLYLEDATFDNRVYNYTGDNVINNFENFPDDENIEEVDGLLRLKDRISAPGFKGYRIIRSDFDFNNFPSGYENSILEIRYNFDVGGGSVTIPSGCILKFDGGKILNAGNINFNNCYIQAEPEENIIESVVVSGKILNKVVFPEWFGAVGDGVNNDSSAFQKAINVAKKDIGLNRKDVYFVVGGVNLTSGLGMVGFGRYRVYSSFSLANMKGSCCIVFDQTASYCIDFKGLNNVRNINFYGVDKSCDGIPNNEGGGKRNSLVFRDVSMCRFRKGFGGGLTVNNSRFWNCQAAYNDTGVFNLVDSHFYGGEINANDVTGIDCQTGANDNVFVGTKNEWNLGNNWNFFSSFSNMVIGGVTDRAGLNGFKITNAGVLVSGVKIRRSGRFLTANNANHFFIEGSNCEVVINGCMTSTGYDDGSGGNESPLFSVALLGSQAGKLIMSGNDFSGALTSGYTAFNSPIEAKITGNIGVEDFVNVGFRQSDGVDTYVKKFSVSTNASASSIDSIVYKPLSTFSRDSFKIVVEARNILNGRTIFGEVVFYIRREGGSATITFSHSLGSSALGNTVSEDIQVEVENVAVDASSFDVRITNNSSSSYISFCSLKSV